MQRSASMSSCSSMLNGRFQVKALSEVNCLVLGPSGIGKTTFLMTAAGGHTYPDKVPNTYNATAFVSVRVGRYMDIYRLNLIDSSKLSKEKRIEYYGQVDVILLCFSMTATKNDSFSELRNKYIPELCEYCPQTPVVLVGMQMDGENFGCSYSCNAKKLFKEQKIVEFIQCSAKNSINLDSVLCACLRAARSSIYNKCEPHYEQHRQQHEQRSIVNETTSSTTPIVDVSSLSVTKFYINNNDNNTGSLSSIDFHHQTTTDRDQKSKTAIKKPTSMAMRLDRLHHHFYLKD